MTIVNKVPPPWYRQGWPWFLMALPAVAVIAGIVTLWLAMSTSDGLVVDDYYKQGLAIQQTIVRSQRAAELGLEARLQLRAESVDLQLAGRSAEAIPERVRIIFSHPTRVGLDQTLVLAGANGRFSGALKELLGGRWDVQIEDEARTWRLNGVANLPSNTEIRIVAASAKPVE